MRSSRKDRRSESKKSEWNWQQKSRIWTFHLKMKERNILTKHKLWETTWNKWRLSWKLQNNNLWMRETISSNMNLRPVTSCNIWKQRWRTCKDQKSQHWWKEKHWWKRKSLTSKHKSSISKKRMIQSSEKWKIETNNASSNSESLTKDKERILKIITCVKKKELKENMMRWLMNMSKSTDNKLKFSRRNIKLSEKRQGLLRMIWETLSVSSTLWSIREIKKLRTLKIFWQSLN